MDKNTCFWFNCGGSPNSIATLALVGHLLVIDCWSFNNSSRTSLFKRKLCTVQFGWNAKFLILPKIASVNDLELGQNHPPASLPTTRPHSVHVKLVRNRTQVICVESGLVKATCHSRDEHKLPCFWCGRGRSDWNVFKEINCHICDGVGQNFLQLTRIHLTVRMIS